MKVDHFIFVPSKLLRTYLRLRQRWLETKLVLSSPVICYIPSPPSLSHQFQESSSSSSSSILFKSQCEWGLTQFQCFHIQPLNWTSFPERGSECYWWSWLHTEPWGASLLAWILYFLPFSVCKYTYFHPYTQNWRIHLNMIIFFRFAQTKKYFLKTIFTFISNICFSSSHFSSTTTEEGRMCTSLYNNLKAICQ